MTEQHARRWDGGAGKDAPMNAEDDVYYRTETVRVHAELVRLDLSVQLRYPRETLLWAFLCTPVYCLKTGLRVASSFLGQSSRSNNTAKPRSAWRFDDGTLRTINSSYLIIWSWLSSVRRL